MKATDSPRVKILVLGTADWNQPIATNQHYVVRELCEDYDVTYVESMGLRRPQFVAADVRRIARRLLPRWGKGAQGREIPISLSLLKPRVIPLHRGVFALLNRSMINLQLRAWSRSQGTKVLWTYTPVTYQLQLAVDAFVYHCVDLLGEVSGIDETLVRDHERVLARTVDKAIGSSERVVQHLLKSGFEEVLLWPNVADISIFEQETELTRSGLLFAGNFTIQKINFALLEHLVQSGKELHLAGPISDSESRASIHRLEAAGATYHGVLALPELAALANRCIIGLIPYVLNRYTVGVSPLKTYEYLAAGLSVVSTNLPGIPHHGASVRIAQDVSEFTASVDDLLSHSPAAEENKRESIGHGWEDRGKDVRALVVELTKSIR